MNLEHGDDQNNYYNRLRLLEYALVDTLVAIEQGMNEDDAFSHWGGRENYREIMLTYYVVERGMSPEMAAQEIGHITKGRL